MGKYTVDDILKEADIAVSDPTWTVATSSMPVIFKPGFIMTAAIISPSTGLALWVGKKLFEKKEKKEEHKQKEILYKKAIAKQNAIIRALRDESKKDKERIESLTQMNKLLQTVIDQLRKDI
jgi:hypothetical protein